MNLLSTIVSGGQTGADRAALDAALACGVSVRGWVPRGRLAEDGIIPDRYPALRETESADPAERTVLNVRDADGCLIVSHGPLAGGSRLAADTAARLDRPLLHIDFDQDSLDTAVPAVCDWLRTHGIRELGVGGPRASEDARIYDATHALIRAVCRCR